MEKEQFLKSHEKFHLGFLPTEQPHKDSIGLSDWVNNDLTRAIEALKQIDVQALLALQKLAQSIVPMKRDIKKVFEQGGRVFLCGCGATGRLALLLEYLWREENKNDKVRAFMAGGDVALVHSLEGFEDFPDLGARHLREVGFGDNDLLISSSEGGETPYVIGATEEAANISKWSPYFLYCNPRDLLTSKIERSRKLIENNKIHDIELFVGPMALSGSTRMQATTVLQTAIGAALLEHERSIQEVFDEFLQTVKQTDYQKLADFVLEESKLYKKNERILYQPEDFAITVFTDTTERSPTFSLPSFENDRDENKEPSFCYICLPKANSKEEAWEHLIHRRPHALNWSELDHCTEQSYLDQFDFSIEAQEKRAQRIQPKTQSIFSIKNHKGTIFWSLNTSNSSWECKSSSRLIQQGLVKVLLNAHSTLLMGRLGRYQSNIMTWVTPTNGKLVDRATRYIEYLLNEEGLRVDYLQIVDEIYRQLGSVAGESIVLKVFNELKSQSQKMCEDPL